MIEIDFKFRKCLGAAMFNQDDRSVEQLVNSRDFNKKIQAILKEAKELGISGDELHLSLLTSGAVMGLEVSQRNFKENTSAVVELLRGCLPKLDALILSTVDEEFISELSKMRKGFSDILQIRSKDLYETYVNYLEDILKIDRVHISEKINIEDYSKVDLQKIGFAVYQALPIYFCSWNHFKATQKLSKFKCHCHTCMLNHLRTETIGDYDRMDAAIDAAGGVDRLFKQFGEFVLNAIKSSLETVAYGDSSHDVDVLDSEQQAKDLLKNLQIVRGREQF